MAKQTETIELEKLLNLSYIRGRKEEVAKVLKALSRPYALFVLEMLSEKDGTTAQADMAASLYEKEGGKKTINFYRASLSQTIKGMEKVDLVDVWYKSKSYPSGAKRVKMVKLKR